MGSFQPRRLALPGVEEFEGKSVHYRVKSAADFHGRDLVICGGGDSALDWTVALCEKARSLTLVHRRAEFRAAPATVARMRELVAAGKMQLLEGSAAGAAQGRRQADRLDVRTADGRDTATVRPIRCWLSTACTRSSGPLPSGAWSWRSRRSRWTPRNSRPACPGIFAIGDINTYPGKKKLILSGFHEAALAAFAIQHHLFPEKRQFLQYTTTSPIMQKRLGVGRRPDPHLTVI